MPLVTKIFDWHDPEFRHADEVYLVVVAILVLLMILGYFLLPAF